MRQTLFGDSLIAKFALLLSLVAHLSGITNASCGLQDVSNNSSWLMPYLLLCEDEQPEIGSGGSGQINPVADTSDCPEPNFVSVRLVDEATLAVDFDLMCLQLDCQYNYTVEFYSPNDILLATDSQMLTEVEVNRTQFCLAATTLRDGAQSFEMGVIVNVSVFVIDGNGSEGQYTTSGDFSPSILDLSVANTTNTTISLMWDLPFPTVIPDIYTIYYNYTELSGEEPRMGENTINVTDTSSTYYTITDLLSYTMYDVSVVAVYDNVSSNDVTTNATTMEGAPTPPQNFTVQQVNNDPTSLNTSWTEPLTINGIITNYSVYCRLSNEQFYPEQETNGEFVLEDSETLSLTISELLPFTSYDCYVTASTIGGESEPSNNDSARTDEDIPTIPTNFTVLEITANSAILEWNRPVTPNGEITEYLLEYSNTSVSDQPLVISIPVTYNRAIDEYNVTSVTVDDLNEFTMYTFNISAITGGGAGATATIDNTTSEAAPSAVPVDLTGVNTSSTSLLIEWLPPPVLDRNGIILGYNITYFSNNGSDVINDVVTNDTMINITGLLVYTEYNVSVAAYTSVGSGPIDSIIIRTDSSVPEAPQNLESRNLTSSSIELSWKPPVFNGPNEGYNVTYRRLETNETVTVSVTNTAVNISGLEIYEEYNIEVVALSDKGAGDTVEILVLTDEDVPGVVGRFEADELNSTAIFVEWDTPMKPNGIITQYEIEYYTLVETVLINASSLSTELTNLEFYTEYAIRVRAYTSVGPGNYTDNITVRTDPAPATPPINVTTTPTERTIVLNWMAPESPHGIIEGYYVSTNATLPVNIDNTTLDDINITVLNVTDSVLSIIFTRLIPFTYYEFSVAAYSFNLMDSTSNFTILTGEFSDNLITQTLQNLPGVVNNFTADELNLSTITVEWSTPLEPNGIIIEYEVEYTLATDNNVSSVNFTADSFTETLYVIELTNLEFHSEYAIRVRAYTSIGPGNYTDNITVRTDPAPATPPTEVTATPTERTIVLNWMAPERPHGIIEGYYVSTNATLPVNIDNTTLDDSNITVLNVSDNVLNITFTGLIPFTYYEFSVAAYSFNLMDSTSNFTILTGEFSDNLITQTLQDSPTPPQNFTVQQVNNDPTSLNTSWTEPLTINGIITNYSVYCRLSNEQFYPEQETNGEFVLEDSETLSLTISELLPFTSYDCYVTASTIGGESEPSNNDSARTDEDIPTIPTNFNVLGITANSATLEWNRPVTPNGEITEYLLEYSNTSVSDQPLMISIPVTYNKTIDEYNVTSITVDDLNEFTIYTFNISAITGGGAGATATIDNITSEAAPSAVPVDLTGVNTSSTSLLIKWLPPPVLDRNGIILGYNITYFSNNGSDVINDVVTNDTMINITGLLVYTEYNVSVAAYTSVGSGPFDSIIIRTDSSVPEAPQNLEYRNLTSSSIELSWKPPVFNGPNEGYNVTYRRLETNETVTESVTNTAVNISGLEIYEEYNIEVVALSDKGAGDTVEILVLTDEDVPGVVGRFEADELNSTAIFVEWDTPMKPNGIITQYEIEYTLVETSTTVLINASSLSTELTNLVFYTEYAIRVRAYTSVGPGNYTDNITVRTDPASATPPINVTTTPTERTIVLNWIAPERPHGIIEGYYVFTNATLPVNIDNTTLDSNITVLNVTDNVLNITFNGLIPFTYYEFSVAAYSFNLMDSTSNFTILTGVFSDNQITQTLQDLPGVVNSFTADELNLSTITVEWSTPLEPNGIIIEYEVEYMLVTDNNASSVNFTANSFTETLFVIELTNLEFHSEYAIRVRAYTSVGPGNYTDNITVRTDPAPATPPTEVTATPTERTIVLNWMAPERPHGIIEGYYVSTNATLPVNIDNTTLDDINITVLNVTDSVLSITFSGLIPFTYYEFSVAAYSFNLMDSTSNFTIITGEFSDNQTTQTQQDSPGVVNNFSADELNLSTITVEWSTPLEPNGIIIEYEVEYTLVTDNTVSSVNFTADSFTETPFVIELTNLEFHSEYVIRVRAYTSVGPGNYTDNITVRTDPAPATPPINVTTTPTERTIVLNWMAPERPHGIIEGYYVSTNATLPVNIDNTTLDDSIITVLNVTGNVLNITFSGLIPFTYYEFSVAAYSFNLMDSTSNFTILTGEFSDNLITQTLQDSPTPPQNFTVQQVNNDPTSLNTSWTEPLTINGIITNYSVYCRLSNEQFYPEQETIDGFALKDSTTPGTLSLTISELLPFTSYDCYVTASTIGGESEPSNNDSARTDEDIPTIPTNFTVLEITANSATLEWNRPVTPNGEITEYLLEYSNTSVSDQPLVISIPVTYNRAIDEYNVTSVTVDDLNEFTMYTFNISAITGGGAGATATIDNTTSEAAPSAVPVDLTGVNTSSTSLLIEWLPPPVLDRNGIILGYNITYFSIVDSNVINDVVTNDTMINITELLVYTEYNVSVAAYTSVGSGPIDSIIIRTDSALPFAPNDLTVVTINATALSVNWSEPSVIRGIRAGYRLQYEISELDSYLSIAYSPIEVEVNSFNVVLSGLHEFAEYSIVVQTMNDKGIGEMATENGMTLQAVPGDGVRNTSVVVLNSTAVNVSWLPPLQSVWNGIITNYTIHYESTDDDITEEMIRYITLGDLVNGGNPRQAPNPLLIESIVVNGLEEFMNYNFTVTVSTSIGPNVPEDTPTDIEITTDEAAPDSSPTDVAIVILNALEANITWSPPLYINRNGLIVLYTVTILDSLGVYDNNPVNVTGTSYTAVGLPQYAVFQVSVSASTIAGRGPFSTPISAMTNEGLPSPVRQVRLTLIDETSISIEWLEPNLPNGIIIGYYVFLYGTKDNGEVFEGLNQNITYVIDNNSTMSLQLTRLLSDTTYSFNVTAYTAAGNGSTGIGGSIYIPVGNPPTIASNSTFAFDTPTDETGNNLTTTTTIQFQFIIPAILNSNGPIQRVRIIARVYLSLTNILSSYFVSSMATFPNIPPYFALEIDINEKRKRGLVKRQATGEEVISETIGSQMNCGVNVEICNGPLREGTEYEFKYRAYNSEDNDSYAESAYSAPISTAAVSSNNSNTVVIAIIVVLVIVVIIVGVAILLIVLYIKCKKKRKMYSFKGNGTSNSESLLRTSPLSTSKRTNTGPTIVPLSENIIPNKSTARATSVKATPHSRKIYLRDLPGYVSEMVSDSGFKFSEEYEKVSLIGLEHSKDASLMPENRAKNRYTNILAYDHSRVKLDYVDDEPGSDYINANYIPGYRVRRAYIATQGPLPSTFDDFWTMVWEQNTHNIVMLTQLVERGRTKCHRYWPGSQPEVYGDIAVEMSSEKELNDWIVRTFQLTKEKRTRTIYHFQFVSWPDHGVPEAATAAVDFVQCVHENIQAMHGPIIVHCSAGVGRTGTFICLGTLLQHIGDHDWIDIFGFSCEMRQHRNHMIQTEAQYVFIHKAMVEVCESLSSFSGRKGIQGFNPIYINVGASSSPGVSQQSDMYMFGNSLLSEETSQYAKTYDESRF